MNQTRLISLVEVCAGVALGFCISAAVWPLVAWWQGFEYSLTSNLQVTLFFTVLSIARGYVVRRFFAVGIHRAAAKFARRVST